MVTHFRVTVTVVYTTGKTKREQSLQELREHIHKYYVPLGRQFMVLFPEGGFLHKRKEISHRFAEKNNLPKLEYVSLPRAGALKVIMDEVGKRAEETPSTSKSKKDDVNQNNRINNVNDNIEWVLDVTIAYPDRIPIHLQDIIPLDLEGMTQWLYDRFIEKEKMLEEFYRTGQFPTRGNTPNIPRKILEILEET
ncbi:acyl-CoA:lysophosphatidylglycerol acyltransferase 1-like [Aricia agestis]|uniref:acyl-CoA:lysophosphatidylglycerol acyltransferase 1-like n=1 Tax=Aricia agestis TaxID=91739 RepID=UPI001C2018CD|nr:acyl-CoA:lysophosphatidylglycerol acyltransferase 1-like [Aricia agestis]